MKLITSGIKSIQKDLFNSVKNDLHDKRNKPLGGFWASTYIQDEEYGPSSSWIDYCRYDYLADFYDDKEFIEPYKHGVIFEISDNSKICKINTLSDYLKVLEKYSCVYEMYSKKKGLDFEKLSQYYDAIHLTQNAVIEMRFILSHNDILDFYSWDCESFVLFNLDCINQNSIEQVEIKYDLKEEE